MSATFDQIAAMPEDREALAGVFNILASGGMGDNDRATVLTRLRPGDVPSGPLRQLFGEMQEAHQRGQPVDTMEWVEHVWAAAGELLTHASLGRPMDSCVFAVMRQHARRRVSAACQQGLELCVSPCASLSEFQAQLRTIVQAAEDHRIGTTAPTMAELVDSAAAQVETARSGARQTLPWCLPFLDAHAPLAPGQLAIVGARPRVGKTALLVSCALRQALAGVPVGIMCLEMGNEAIIHRMASQLCGVSYGSIVAGLAREPADALQRHAVALHVLRDLPLALHCGRPMALADVETVAREWVAERGVRVLWLDYLQRVQPRQQKDRWAAVAELSRGLKDLALALQVPVVALAQLNRSAEGVEPQLAHLGESAQIEQDADTITLLDRPDADGPGGGKRQYQDGAAPLDLRGKIVLRLAKNRNGQTGAEVEYFHAAGMCVGPLPFCPAV